MNNRKVILFPSNIEEQTASSKLIRIIKKAGMTPIQLQPGLDIETIRHEINEADIVLIAANDKSMGQPSSNWDKEILLLQQIKEIENKDTVVWFTQNLISEFKQQEKNRNIEQIKRLFPHQHFMTYTSLIKLTDDLRNIKIKDHKQNADRKLDLTIIANESDAQMLERSSILIDGVLKMNSILVDISTEKDYALICSESILQSKLCVILAQKAADWAVHFSQQIWKITGGASSEVPMLVIFDKNTTNRSEIQLVIPNVTVLFTDDSLAGLEIKVHFDKITAPK
jgi:hypothetical protein